MAADLDLKVICEGVETVEQAKLLQSLHCPMAQGFLFDAPLPHGKLDAILKSDRIYHKI